MKIAVVGSGYVGLVAGACFAENGNEVICIDKDPAKIRTLKRGNIPIYEPGLEELVRRNRAEKRLTFTTELARGARSSQVIFIAVGTPTGEDGSADLQHVLNVARERLQGRREQEHGAGGDGGARAQNDLCRDETALQRRE
jgi:UDPglucose 6-dehydrogenase